MTLPVVGPQHTTEELWDLQAEILTELSRRDGVQYRVRATDTSVDEKMHQITVNSSILSDGW